MEDTNTVKNLIIVYAFLFIIAAALIIAFIVLAYLTRENRRRAAEAEASTLVSVEQPLVALDAAAAAAVPV
jgi:flagellar biosynthesis/type III secretory pathway M-ring protein FliF/YscJ